MASFPFFSSLPLTATQLHKHVRKLRGLAEFGWTYYFVFVAWDVCASVLWYFFWREHFGRVGVEKLGLEWKEKRLVDHNTCVCIFFRFLFIPFPVRLEHIR